MAGAAAVAAPPADAAIARMAAGAGNFAFEAGHGLGLRPFGLLLAPLASPARAGCREAGFRRMGRGRLRLRERIAERSFQIRDQRGQVAGLRVRGFGVRRFRR